MKKQSTLTAIWALGLLLTNVLLVTLSETVTDSLKITAVYVWIAFISAYLFQRKLWNTAKDKDDLFLKTPALTMAVIYEFVQIPVAAIMAIKADIISIKTAILINTIILVVFWALMMAGITGNGHIKSVNSRQKNHHTEL